MSEKFDLNRWTNIDHTLVLDLERQIPVEMWLAFAYTMAPDEVTAGCLLIGELHVEPMQFMQFIK